MRDMRAAQEGAQEPVTGSPELRANTRTMVLSALDVANRLLLNEMERKQGLDRPLGDVATTLRKTCEP